MTTTIPACHSERSEESLPRGWTVTTVGKMAATIQYGHTASAIKNPNGPRFLRITDIQNGKVEWDGVPSCEISKDEISKYKLQDGDLVFARTGATTGKSFLIQNCPEAVFASYLIRLRLNDGVSPAYVSLFFQSGDYWRQIETGKRGIGQPNVNAQTLSKIQFPLPPPPEQRHDGWPGFLRQFGLRSHNGIGKRSRLKLAKLLRDTKGTISVEQATGSLDLSPKKAAKTLAWWAKQGWLSRVRRGLYVPVPLETRTGDVALEDPWLVAERLFAPCYIGGWSAAEHWDLTEQIFRGPGFHHHGRALH